MRPWPKGPLIYEINTWVWLHELSQQVGYPLTLASVPDPEWDRIAELGFDVVWLMGIWERSPDGIRISMANETLLADFRRALPNFESQDNVGSPYCVRRYIVDAHLGGSEALALTRSKLADRGVRLLLDFVPNHVAPDHPWVYAHPDYFIQGTPDDMACDPNAFIAIDGRVFACGRDPYFPAWPDVLQLNAFNDQLRAAATDTLTTIAGQCDGVRCDMAMLMTNAVFERTWGHRAGMKPEIEYWSQVISAVKAEYLDFQFMAEAYWDMEWELQQQGFDYCYDKCLYDRLAHDTGERVRLHLSADLTYQAKLVRFIENHDEPRAAAIFDPAKHRAAAVSALTLPGARLIHEGQMAGRRTRLPVFLGRRPAEAPDPDLFSFYQDLLRSLHSGHFMQGRWQLCERSGWPDNQSHVNLVSWGWQRGEAYCLIVVNLAASSSQGLVRLPWDYLRGRTWQLKDLFTSTIYERHGDEMCGSGLYVDLPPWGFHILILSGLLGQQGHDEIRAPAPSLS
jgi:glycosidase